MQEHSSHHNSSQGPMVIEWLTFQVPAEFREQFVQQDDAIWRPFLEQQPGYLGKETWISPDQATEVIILIRWRSQAQWQAISASQLQEVEATFNEAVGTPYELVESNTYQVRKFPQPVNS